MKHIIILFIIITLTSCSFFNDTKVDFSIKNSSNNVLKNIVFKTSCDSIIIKELKPNEILKKELLYSTSSNKDKNVTFGFRLNFLKDSQKRQFFLQ